MASCFHSIPALNTMASYESLKAASPELWEAFPKEAKANQSIDELDFFLLTRTHKDFKTIFKCNDILLVWARAFSRLEEIGEESNQTEFRADWPYKQQSCATLAKKALTLVSTDVQTPEADALVKICRASNLFFRVTSSYLAFLYKRMDSVKYLDELHPFQHAPNPQLNQGLPSPPRSCWSQGLQWSQEDWPLEHCSSWEHYLSIVRGIFGHAQIELKSRAGLTEKISFIQWCSRLDWKGLWASFNEFGKGVGMKLKAPCTPRNAPVEYSATFSLSEFFSDPLNPRSQPLVPENNSALIVNLIRAGIHPFAILDTSELATGNPTEWTKGASSPHYVPLFHLACEYGTREMVEALLEDGQCLREYYDAKKSDRTDSPYLRAVMNYNHPSVLIPLLEEAARNPTEPLAQEILTFEAESEKHKRMPPFFARFSGDRIWRRHPQNYLLLACVGGDLEFAKYLVEREEAGARSKCSPQASEQERQVAAAIASSSFVNCKGDCFSPKGTPVEIANHYGQAEVVQFLCEKGAVASLEVRVAATRQVNSMMIHVVSQWDEIQEKMRLELQNLNFEVSQSQLDELTSIAMAHGRIAAEQQKQIQSCSEIVQGNSVILDRINRGLDMLEGKSHQLIIQSYRQKNGLGRESSIPISISA